MRAELAELQLQIKQLHAQHSSALQKIERNRQQTAKATQQVTAMRTDMLTRRQRHRSVLAQHGVQEGQLPAAFSAPAGDEEAKSSVPTNPMEMLAALAAPEPVPKRKTRDESTKSDTADSNDGKNGSKAAKRRRG